MSGDFQTNHMKSVKICGGEKKRKKDWELVLSSPASQNGFSSLELTVFII